MKAIEQFKSLLWLAGAMFTAVGIGFGAGNYVTQKELETAEGLYKEALLNQAKAMGEINSLQTENQNLSQTIAELIADKKKTQESLEFRRKLSGEVILPPGETKEILPGIFLGVYSTGFSSRGQYASVGLGARFETITSGQTITEEFFNEISCSATFSYFGASEADAKERAVVLYNCRNLKK
ncbi:hypothetical protein [Thalassospira indica]|uniref:Uncharacterized protein n=1 Tax=Thalassospira indica TaxID=1891279 RepID=A0ABM6XXK3_9PROT|nr:hypothetical protein [Thalassospira indica]AXO14432.1 hypothetical protein DY252_09530 [Thalassospira indica]OAZ11385.1 hypothetical protein TH15_18125 [Thalassospira profundimaris]